MEGTASTRRIGSASTSARTSATPREGTGSVATTSSTSWPWTGCTATGLATGSCTTITTATSAERLAVHEKQLSSRHSPRGSTEPPTFRHASRPEGSQICLYSCNSGVLDLSDLLQNHPMACSGTGMTLHSVQLPFTSIGIGISLHAPDRVNVR